MQCWQGGSTATADSAPLANEYDAHVAFGRLRKANSRDGGENSVSATGYTETGTRRCSLNETGETSRVRVIRRCSRLGQTGKRFGAGGQVNREDAGHGTLRITASAGGPAADGALVFGNLRRIPTCRVDIVHLKGTGLSEHCLSMVRDAGVRWLGGHCW